MNANRVWPLLFHLTAGMVDALWHTYRDPVRLQRRRLRGLLHFAAARSPFYRDLYGHVDLETATLDDLPPVDKRTIMAQWDRVVTDRSLRKDEVLDFVARAPRPPGADN